MYNHETVCLQPNSDKGRTGENFNSQKTLHTRPPLQWRNNERDGVSNHRHLNCLLKRLFRRRSKTKSNVRVTGLCDGNQPITGGCPSQRASNAEHISIWWHHHAWVSYRICCGLSTPEEKIPRDVKSSLHREPQITLDHDPNSTGLLATWHIGHGYQS